MASRAAAKKKKENVKIYKLKCLFARAKSRNGCEKKWLENSDAMSYEECFTNNLILYDKCLAEEEKKLQKLNEENQRKSLIIYGGAGLLILLLSICLVLCLRK